MKNINKIDEKRTLTKLYRIINWVDMGLLALVVLNFFNTLSRVVGFANSFELIEALSYEPNLIDHFIDSYGTDTIMGVFELSGPFAIFINLAWFAVTLLALFVTVKLHKNGHIGRFHAYLRYFMWGIFLPLDLIYIVGMLRG